LPTMTFCLLPFCLRSRQKNDDDDRLGSPAGLG